MITDTKYFETSSYKVEIPQNIDYEIKGNLLYLEKQNNFFITYEIARTAYTAVVENIDKFVLNFEQQEFEVVDYAETKYDGDNCLLFQLMNDDGNYMLFYVSALSSNVSSLGCLLAVEEGYQEAFRYVFQLNDSATKISSFGSEDNLPSMNDILQGIDFNKNFSSMKGAIYPIKKK